MEDPPFVLPMTDEVLQHFLDPNPDLSLGQEQSAPCWNQNQDQDHTLSELSEDLDCPSGCDRDQNQDHKQHHRQDQAQEQDRDHDQAQGLISANLDAAVESAGSIPALVITQVEESAETSAAVPEPEDLAEPSVSAEAEMACGDLLSLRSDTLSLAGDSSPSRTSEDDDSTSVTASSVISLFQRVQLDPLEKEWLKSSALGDIATQRRLLRQDGSLLMKKDFVTTALHWAAKQGRLEVLNMMLLSGADINARSGYTALHLASIHGHQHVVHALINTHKSATCRCDVQTVSLLLKKTPATTEEDARTSLRDYHGKTAAHYWSGSRDVFERRDPQPGVTFSRLRHTQRRVLPSLLLTRSRSQGQLCTDLRTSQELWV